MEENTIYYYAQINSENICVATQQTAEQVSFENMIQLSSAQEMATVLGKKYENGLWKETPKEEVEEPLVEPSVEEVLQAKLLLTQQEILIGQQRQEEILERLLREEALQKGGSADA